MRKSKRKRLNRYIYKNQRVHKLLDRTSYDRFVRYMKTHPEAELEFVFNMCKNNIPMVRCKYYCDGITLKEFCKKNNLKYGTAIYNINHKDFNYWLKKNGVKVEQLKKREMKLCQK